VLPTGRTGIRSPSHGLFEHVLALTAEELTRAHAGRRERLVRIGGICGETTQAAREAALLHKLGYHAGLLSLAAMKGADEDELIAHCRAVAKILPVVGFYLQAAVDG
jgi:dihydrodipicolinate synthase/N-acetylneuraminate lyase